jgi:hypothetical protein
LLSPKKSKQRKATARRCPSVFPFAQVKKWENVETLFVSLRFTTLKHDAFLSIFCPAQTAAPKAD